MPQKRNPDVAELIRSSCHVIQACLQEVMSISSSVSTGYHRDFQRLKYPLVRGVELTKKVVDILIHILPEIVFKKGKIESACNIEIYATKRALDLVKQGMTFRDAYKHVAKEVENKSLPRVTGERVPNIDHALTQIKARLNNLSDWNNNICKYENETLSNLLNIFDLF
jgi:argininosuccinate lyase